MTTQTKCRLYLISPPKIDTPIFIHELRAALSGGDVASFQLRLKDATDDEILRAGEALMPLAQNADVAFILNDRPDLAARMGADGVHIGQEDATYAEARAALGTDRIVGVTCHDSRHLAMEAAEKGADYVAFGAFFPTATKDPKTSADLDVIRWWADTMLVPCVAIGGIMVDNAKPLVAAGAEFLAVSSGVWNHADGPAAAVRAFNDVFRSAMDG